ncbi:MAG: hypothetical protein D6701_10070 [Gemmatimonadetes bacterium]|nr:MAG: hypothetical protein D6701_10070 [Gemmatimonadota bacterium]
MRNDPTPSSPPAAHPRGEPLDAFATTGSSPTDSDPAPATQHGPAPADVAACRSSPCPTVHVVGLGPVGLALVELLESESLRLAAVSDSSGTARAREADLRADVLRRGKQAGGALADELGGRAIPLVHALGDVAADIVVDATATSFDRAGWGELLEGAVLARGAHLVFAAKDGPALHLPAWLRRYPGQVGVNAVLGGAGAALLAELRGLRASTRAVRIAGNATTTTIIQAIERGGTIDEGVAAATAAGLLEADPELDLRGRDAAVKLAVVVGALTGRAVEPAAIPSEDVRSLDPEELRRRARGGRTTRLVGRWDGGRPVVRYEALALDDPLAVAADEVAYAYRSRNGLERVHRGGGIGPLATARAALVDVRAAAEVWVNREAVR